MIDRKPKPCAHKRVRHQHGHYVTYVSDRCRCLPCAIAYSEYAEWMKDRASAQRVNLVSDTAARVHIASLRRDGWPVDVIAQRTGVSRWTIERLIHGDPRAIQIANERRILAFKGLDDDRTFLVDATGTRRRIEALIAIGWPIAVLHRRAGLGDHTLHLILKPGSICRQPTRDAIRSLYDELWDRPAPRGQVASRTINRAQKLGYAPPLAWDDDSIDDPAARPQTGEPEPVVKPDHAERQAMYDQGMSDRAIARHEHVSADTIRYWRMVNKLPPHSGGKPLAPLGTEGDNRYALWQQGMGDKDIAAAVSRHPDVIRRWRGKHGLEPGRRAG